MLATASCRSAARQVQQRPQQQHAATPMQRVGAGPSRRAQLRPARSTGAAAAPAPAAAPDQAITLTPRAISHLTKLRAEAGGEGLLLRVGVKQGGCSGMSYAMDFAREADISDDDYVMNYDGGFRLVVDPKSLLYLFGMSLDHSDELIGGGFKFSNPNATDSCGCGKSFGV